MTKALAIDFGTERIGLAISRGTLAEPLAIISARDNPIQTIRRICDEEAVEQLVVGLSENTMAEKTRVFAEQLEADLGLPVAFMDETLSSKTVAGQLKDAGASLKRRQQPIDDLAAAHFLQEWLDLG